jgi:hypothetical protein
MVKPAALSDGMPSGGGTSIQIDLAGTQRRKPAATWHAPPPWPAQLS